MKVCNTGRPQRSRVTAPVIQNSLLPHYTDSEVFIKEVETERVITRERIYIVARPVCSVCGVTMELGGYHDAQRQ